MTAKYQLYKDKAGKYRFRLVAENGRTIATGEAYERRASCLNGIESVKKNSDSQIEDRTIDSPKIPFPKYEIFLDKAGEFRFNLSASNGEVIASSEGYNSKEGGLNGINAVKRLANSEVEDQTAEMIKKETAPLEEPKPIVTHKEESSKKPEPSAPYKEQNNKIPVPTTAATLSKEMTTSNKGIQSKQKGISRIALVVLPLGLVIGVVLLAIGLGFAGILPATDLFAKTVMMIAGELVLSASILFFFAKK